MKILIDMSQLGNLKQIDNNEHDGTDAQKKKSARAIEPCQSAIVHNAMQSG